MKKSIVNFRIAFFLAHIPLALLMYQINEVATVHAVITLLVGLWLAVTGRRQLTVARVGAYITGCEVLWRMNDFGLFWEFSKYALILIFLIAIFRSGNLRAPLLPFIYFLLLLPSVALVTTSMDMLEARENISFNLSGPLAIAVGAWFFSRLTITQDELFQILFALITPLGGITTIALIPIMTGANIQYGIHSNFQTSGNFGPVQVSSIMGLGAFAAVLYALISKMSHWTHRLFVFLSGIVFTAQSAITFSRSGLYFGGGSILIAALYLMRDTRSRIKIMIGTIIFALILNFFIFPRLEDITQGVISKRFESTNLTGRDRLAMDDLEIWSENPILGVGPGLAARQHQTRFRNAETHTEYTRLLAEHGVLGMIALMFLVLMVGLNVYRAVGTENKAVIASIQVWSLLFMTAAGLRLLAPAFLLGFAFVTIWPEQEEEWEEEVAYLHEDAIVERSSENSEPVPAWETPANSKT